MSSNSIQPTDAAQRAIMAKKVALFDQVDKDLFSWKQWAKSTERGVLTPHQFLAVLLYMLSNDTHTTEECLTIVDEWAKVITLACEKKLIRPLSPVTLLPVGPKSWPNACVISITDANNLLTAMPIGFDLALVLEHFRSEAEINESKGATELTYANAVEQRKSKDDDSRWTDPQLAAVWKEIEARKGKKAVRKAIANEIGISESSLNTALNKRKPIKSSDAKLTGNSTNSTVHLLSKAR